MATTSDTKKPAAKKTAAKKPKDHNPPADEKIVVKTKKRGTIPVELGGEDYQATPPKALISMKFAQSAQEAGEDAQKLVEALFDWLEITFGDEQAEGIKERLYDGQDDLDFAEVMELMKLLTERTTQNPTT